MTKWADYPEVTVRKKKKNRNMLVTTSQGNRKKSAQPTQNPKLEVLQSKWGRWGNTRVLTTEASTFPMWPNHESPAT